MLKVFVSYSHADREMRTALVKHLSLLKRQKIIETWTDQEVEAGVAFDPAIREALETADIILLLVSADFLASDYCYDIEMKRAVQRHEEGSARVVPVILRPCDWHSAPFGRLKALPEDGQPVSTSADRDAALLQVATAIRKVAPQKQETPADAAARPVKAEQKATPKAAKNTAPIRVRLPRSFTDRDRDTFIEEGFEHIANVFEVSLKALAEENDDCDVRFKRRSDSEFTATIYRHGDTAAECMIWYETGGLHGRGIQFSNSASSHGGYNEQLRVEDGDGALCFKALIGASRGAGDHLDYQAAAQHLWTFFVDRLRWAS